MKIGQEIELAAHEHSHRCQHGDSEDHSDHAHAGRPAGNPPANKTIYTCPMHPEIEQDHPGDCPICGMRLEPKTGVAKGRKKMRRLDPSLQSFGSASY